MGVYVWVYVCVCGLSVAILVGTCFPYFVVGIIFSIRGHFSGPQYESILSIELGLESGPG